MARKPGAGSEYLSLGHHLVHNIIIIIIIIIVVDVTVIFAISLIIFAFNTCHIFMVAHNCHGKTKNLTARPNTSQQKQNSFNFAVSIVMYLVFAVKYLVLP